MLMNGKREIKWLEMFDAYLIETVIQRFIKLTASEGGGVTFMEENTRENRRKMRNQILGCYWVVNAENLYL